MGRYALTLGEWTSKFHGRKTSRDEELELVIQPAAPFNPDNSGSWALLLFLLYWVICLTKRKGWSYTRCNHRLQLLTTESPLDKTFLNTEENKATDLSPSDSGIGIPCQWPTSVHDPKTSPMLTWHFSTGGRIHFNPPFLGILIQVKEESKKDVNKNQTWKCIQADSFLKTLARWWRTFA
jgi:hypothetical protein